MLKESQSTCHRLGVQVEKTKHFCVLPWVHASLTHEGEFSICCLTRPSLGGQLLSEVSVEEARNSEPVRAIRRSMLRDEPSPHCSYCYQIEETASPSPRMVANRTFPDEAKRIYEAQSENLSQTPLRSLDVRFSNVCNLKCRTCGPSNSTSWLADAKALGYPLPADTLRLTKADSRVEGYVRSVLPGIKQLYFAGGEPILEESHYKLLESLLSQGRDDVILDYNSNFSVLKCGSRDILGLWNKFQTVKVGASLDGMGPQFEYLRKGAEWAKILENHRRLRQEAPNVLFYVYPTISVMNVFHLPTAIEAWVREGLIQWPDQLVLNYLSRPQYFSVEILNPEERLRLKASYETFMGRIKNPLVLRTAIIRALRTVLDTVERRPFGPVQRELRARFREVTGTVDRLRQERFEDLFPELGNLMS